MPAALVMGCAHVLNAVLELKNYVSTGKATQWSFKLCHQTATQTHTSLSKLLLAAHNPDWHTINAL